MRAKAIAALLLALAVAATVVAPAGAAGKGKKKSGPQVVGTDDKGDYAYQGDTSIAPFGDALGQDLVEASIGMADKKTVNFIMKVTQLPPWGGWPEITRYNWDFTIDGDMLELDGKFTNYSRGVCDPTSGQCPPPRDPGQAPFFIRGNCSSVGTTIVCEELGIVHATLDAAEGTITVPVPLELIGAKPGSEIGPGVTDFGESVAAVPSAFFSLLDGPKDTMPVTKTFRVPSGKKK